MNYDRPELLDRLAAEYVLGTMSDRVRRRFQAIERALPRAAEAVIAWERRLHPLARSVPPVQPRAATWQQIERRIGAAPVSAESPRWRSWLAPLLGVAFGVIATVGLVRLYPNAIVPIDEIVQERGSLPASYVGLLTDSADAPVVLASSTRHGRTMSIKILRKIDVPAGKVLQLWAHPAKGAPFPLGTVPAEGKGSFQMADTSEKLLANVPRLAVSLEDAPAAPGASPGQVILTGNCVKLW
jgi:anti-sigma-K factor RskA